MSVSLARRGAPVAMRNVCVFCGSNLGLRPAYAEAARRLGKALAERGMRLVYGGAASGLMGVVADAVLAAGGKVHGVLPRFMASCEIAHDGLTQLHLVDTMAERKARMADLADAFVALPGGYGTLDEVFEVLSSAQVGQITDGAWDGHAAGAADGGRGSTRIGLLDVGGYYERLVAFLDHATGEGLLRQEHRAMLIVESDARRLLDRLT